MQDNQQNAILNSVTPQSVAEDEFVSRNGVRFKLTRIKEVLLTDTLAKIPLPKPPVIMIAEKGREEENPNDPYFLQQLQEVNYKRGQMTIGICLTLGTRLVPPLPAGIDPVESKLWSTEIQSILSDVEIPEAGRARYLAWLKYYVLDSDELLALLYKVQGYSGRTLEADVQQAQNSFRDTETQPADNVVPINTQNQ